MIFFREKERGIIEILFAPKFTFGKNLPTFKRYFVHFYVKTLTWSGVEEGNVGPTFKICPKKNYFKI